MLSNWWVQQGLFGEKLKGWQLLCYESHAEEIYKQYTKRKHNRK